MGFQQGLSGLSASSKALDSVGNNVANAGTVGFKASTTAFADVFAASLGSASNQVGIGTSVNGINQQFTQGNITVTNNALDMAINGQGFFRLSNNGIITWTRNGQFNLDKDGFLVNSSGYRLTGYLANANNLIVPSTPLDIEVSTADLTPQATGGSASQTGLQMGMNLDSREPVLGTSGKLTGSAAPVSTTITSANDEIAVTVDGTSYSATLTSGTYTVSSLATAVQTALRSAGAPVTVTLSSGNLVIRSNTTGPSSSVTTPTGDGVSNLLGVPVPTAGVLATFDQNDPTTYNSSTSATVYDSLGNPHLMSIFFQKSSANEWALYTSLDGGAPSAASTLEFDATGRLVTPSTGIVTQSFALTTGAQTPLSFNLDLEGSTQYGSIFGVNSITQDGYASGRLSGLSVAADGTIQGRYSNGQTRDLAQVILGNFTNPNGLTSLGNNQWGETAESGQPLVGGPGSGTLGAIQSAAIEESNVDLTKELVDMITFQRAYQANAQTIRTQDQILQTLVNLR